MITKFQQKVYNVVKRIPAGRVMTYAAVAKAVGKPKTVRAVGNALNKNNFRDVPCHRVIRSDGKAGGYNRGTKKKIKLLLREGIKIKNGKIINGRYHS
ncbi:MAG: MGMT family protein [Candidatus Sungiibacteriota bacterium]|uniref:MGMT family protein n=1 Tax=Candidatus Sungiibacteriota bacterium TaxID=2750080 RepID=A0A7T5RIW7_9BACT|nr:MAG: MGMT family protein [Candidatus Sungbacteria bacterium]